MAAIGNLKITSDRKGQGPLTGFDCRLELDGRDISAIVSRVVLDVDANNVVTAEITIFPSSVEIDTDALITMYGLEPEEE